MVGGGVFLGGGGGCGVGGFGGAAGGGFAATVGIRLGLRCAKVVLSAVGFCFCDVNWRLLGRRSLAGELQCSRCQRAIRMVRCMLGLNAC